MSAPSERSEDRRQLLWAMGGDAVLYAFALWLLGAQGWGARDVVWSLWSTSLITGYITIVLAIFGGGIFGLLRAARAGEGPSLIPGLLALLLIGGLMLAFFTVHFGLFHAIHAVFLNSFFPLLPGLVPGGDLVGQTLQYLRQCLHLYPGFIALCVLAQLPEWLRAAPAPAAQKSAMMTPYAHVVKLHLMILAIGFAEALGVEAAALIVFLGVYFLPVGAIWRHFRPV